MDISSLGVATSDSSTSLASQTQNNQSLDKDAFMKLLVAQLKNQDPFQQLLFSKIVPNCKKLGLLDANDGWLRDRFDTLGVSQFEDWADTGEEYELLDEVAKDRAVSPA